ncbi:MAG: hypothetical protein M1814_002063 [Vezdaea aestivalis]|nr:MAG: hypothetical protein M1814_002063 [Vezdaea aestivalis]
MWPAAFLAIWLAFCSWTQAGEGDTTDVKSIPLRTHSLSAPYLDSDMQSRWFDYGGSTVIRADRYIRLTSQQQSQAGYLFSRVPLTATNWEIEIEFKIHGTDHLFGDGMAVWVTKDRAKQGTVFGMMDNFEGLGIFFDTYKNNRPGVVFPYVMAMVGDGKTSYDSGSDGKVNEIAGCSARGIRNADIPTRARLTYFQDKSLTLHLQYKEADQWILCFETGAIVLPSVSYLGFSAETGELSDNHDIIRVETRNLYSADRPAGGEGRHAGAGPGQEWKEPIRGQESSGWGWWFIKVILFLAVMAVGYIGFTVYRTQHRGGRF